MMGARLTLVVEVAQQTFKACSSKVDAVQLAVNRLHVLKRLLQSSLILIKLILTSLRFHLVQLDYF